MPTDPDELFTVEPLRNGRPSPGQWAADPAPLDGELFTSWFSRFAEASAIGPEALYLNVRKLLNRPKGDLDLQRHPRLIAYLSQRTGHDISQLERLQRFAHAPGGAWGRIVVSPRFCSRCWRDDAVPHVPWPWRINRMTLCFRHGRWLRHRCPKCRAPFSLLAGVKRRPIWCCQGCGHDLRTGDGGRVPTTILHDQTIFKDVADLADELDRSTLIFKAIDVMAELRGLDHSGRDLRQNVALPGNYMEIADKLLKRVPEGPMRQHLLHVLSSESFKHHNKAESLPGRCSGSFSAGG